MGTSRESTGSGEFSITERVVEAVADAEGVDELELPPLYDSIDADALETLLSETATDDGPEVIEVTFRYCGYTVSVDGDETVQVALE